MTSEAWDGSSLSYKKVSGYNTCFMIRLKGKQTFLPLPSFKLFPFDLYKQFSPNPERVTPYETKSYRSYHNFNISWSTEWFLIDENPMLGIFSRPCNTLPITVAARSKAWIAFACSNAGIVGSNPTRGMNVCVYSLFVLCSDLATGW
jgi:hypothetical protein